MTSLIPNRQEAGRKLARLLRHYENHPQALVLALPRGGVPIAFEIAQALHLPMDVCLVRKLGVPGRPELAMGAIASHHNPVLLPDIIQSFQITPQDLQQVIDREQQELERRETVYRGDRPAPSIQNHVIILVDDGIATGATLGAAIQLIAQQHPHQIVVAIPVAPPHTCQTLKQQVNQVVCLLQPPELHSISLWYEDFPQISDREVCWWLSQAVPSQN